MAISELDKLNKESYKDAAVVMQLLRDNLALWSSEMNEEGEDDEEEEYDDEALGVFNDDSVGDLEIETAGRKARHK